MGRGGTIAEGNMYYLYFASHFISDTLYQPLFVKEQAQIMSIYIYDKLIDRQTHTEKQI